MAGKVDYYQVLGVSSTSNLATIERAYKQKAMILHPDKNKSAKAVELFQQLSTAYRILRDARKRREYDSSRLTGTGYTSTKNRPASTKVDPVEYLLEGLIGGMLQLVSNSGSYALSALQFGREHGPQAVHDVTNFVQGPLTSRPRRTGAERAGVEGYSDSGSSGSSESSSDEETADEGTTKTSVQNRL